jgi:CSLREA domain-containing protein
MARILWQRSFLRRKGVVASAVALAAGGALALHPIPAAAKHVTTFNVTTTSDEHDTNPGDGMCVGTDDGMCSLRAAVEEADAQSGSLLIRVPTGLYGLTLGQLTVSGDITINGANRKSTVVRGNQPARIFLTTASVTIKNLVIEGGDDAQGGGIDNQGSLTLHAVVLLNNQASGNGGGILNESAASLNMTRVELRGNEAGGAGGGIYNDAELSLQKGSIQHNDAASGDGGGLYNTANASALLSEVKLYRNTSGGSGGGALNRNVLDVFSSQFQNNRAQGNGGGIDNEGGLVPMAYTTITNNRANGTGGGIQNDGGALCCATEFPAEDYNLTIFDNTAGDRNGGLNTVNGGVSELLNVTFDQNDSFTPRPFSQLSNDATSTTTVQGVIVKGMCSGPITSNGYNLESGTSCGFTGSGDLQKTDPMLADIAHNGGFAQTQALLPGSPAIDAISPSACPPPGDDERGVSRPQGPACDIGAYEVAASP